MPIVEEVASDEPLAQGDILRGLPFALTDEQGNVTKSSTCSYLLVLTRPCQAIHAPSVMVAQVSPWPVDIRRAKAKATAKEGPEFNLDRMRRFLQGIRDGGQFTDKFYLGDFDGTARFAADLGNVSTVMIPTEEKARAEWVESHRVYRLSPEFARDLHVRVFLTVARMGFDDHSWFSDSDLEIMVNEGEGALAELKLAASKATAEVQHQTSLNDPKKADKVRPAQAKTTIDVSNAEEALAPYKAELERRHGKSRG